MTARLREWLRVLFPSPNKFAPDPPPAPQTGRHTHEKLSGPAQVLLERAATHEEHAVWEDDCWRRAIKTAEESKLAAAEHRKVAHQLRIAAAALTDPGKHNQRSPNMM